MSFSTLIQNMGVLAAKQTGSLATLSRTVAGTTTTCPCSITPDASSLVTLGFKFGQQGLVQAGDLALDIPNKGLTFIPAPGDRITATLDGESNVFSIIGVQPDYFQGVATNYSCLVRR